MKTSLDLFFSFFLIFSLFILGGVSVFSSESNDYQMIDDSFVSAPLSSSTQKTESETSFAELSFISENEDSTEIIPRIKNVKKSEYILDKNRSGQGGGASNNYAETSLITNYIYKEEELQKKDLKKEIEKIEKKNHDNIVLIDSLPRFLDPESSNSIKKNGDIITRIEDKDVYQKKNKSSEMVDVIKDISQEKQEKYYFHKAPSERLLLKEGVHKEEESSILYTDIEKITQLKSVNYDHIKGNQECFSKQVLKCEYEMLCEIRESTYLLFIFLGIFILGICLQYLFYKTFFVTTKHEFDQ